MPIAGSQIAQYAINLLTIALVGRRFPTAALAAVALATVFYYGVCKMAVSTPGQAARTSSGTIGSNDGCWLLQVLGLAGALNTLASQVLHDSTLHAHMHACPPACTRQRTAQVNVPAGDDSDLRQAVGAERMDAMPAIFQRCLLFLFLHAIPMAVAIVMAPRGYAALGYDPEVTSPAGSPFPTHVSMNAW